MIARFVSVFGRKQIVGVLADREFCSGDLFQWLNQEKIPFYIRIKEDSIVRVGNKKLCKAEKIFHEVTPKKTLLFPMKVEIFRQSVYLAGSRSALE